MTDDPSWDVWFNTAVKDVKAARKNGVVTIYNQEYLPTREYTFKNAWPSRAQGHRHERQHRGANRGDHPFRLRGNRVSPAMTHAG